MSTTMPVPVKAHHVNGAAAHPTPAVPDISGTMLTLTPAMADALLRNRPRNRPITKSRVRAMIDDLKGHRWRPNGEPIILDQDGLLLDGQHRCMAVMESGISMVTMAVIGVAREDMASIDQGARRNGSDHLSMHDFSNTGTLASTCRWHYRYERNLMRVQAVPLLDRDLPAYLAGRPGLPSSLSWGRMVRSIIPQSCASMLYHVMAQKDAGAAKAYFDVLAHGGELARDHAWHITRERVLRERAKRTHVVTVTLAAALVIGWNAVRQDRQGPLGVWRGEKDDAAPFPLVV